MYFLLLSLFFSSLLLALTHAALQDCTSPHTLGLHFFFPLCPNGRMASLFNSSSFPSFLPFTLFTSSHNKCKPITLTLLQPKSPFLQLLRPNDLALYFFLFFLPSACPTCLSQPTHADFVHNYRGKDEPNFFSFGQAPPASSICFVDFLPIFLQAH